MMKVFIGCSGWNYKDWRGTFYPEKLSQKNWLEFYSEKFDSVEVNYTFYRFPKESTVENWKRIAPPGFNFTLKGSRYITQMKKLTDVEESVKKFEDVAALLKTKLSCILWQLPPSLHRDDKKLINFCKLLKTSNRNVIEFRHKSWFNEEVYEILKKYHISFCSISFSGFPEDMIVTRKKTAYVRFHGKGKQRYRYLYSKEELREWYEKIKNCGANEVYIYFNNDYDANGPRNAMELRKMFDEDN